MRRGRNHGPELLAAQDVVVVAEPAALGWQAGEEQVQLRTERAVQQHRRVLASELLDALVESLLTGGRNAKADCRPQEWRPIGGGQVFLELTGNCRPDGPRGGGAVVALGLLGEDVVGVDEL